MHPPGAPLESETLQGQGSTCWDSLLCSQKCEDGVENQETVRIHTQAAWLNGHMGAAKEEREQNCLKQRTINSTHRTATHAAETLNG